MILNEKEDDPYWFTTFTGKKFYPFSPRIEDIDIKDIAHSLSLICRFNGHLPEHYSVAQHSVLVSYLVPTELALEGLMHDAAEAYFGDWIRPIKKHPIMHYLKNIEQKIFIVIAHKFKLFEFRPNGFSLEKYEKIKHADTVALLTEKRDLFPLAANQVWSKQEQIEHPDLEADPLISIPFVHPGFAEQQFLHRYEELKRV